jgi:microsomal epoxide hydrolase
MTPQDVVDSAFNYEDLTETEKAGVARRKWYNTTEYAYLLEQCYRTSTIGFVVASNPIALLGWCVA